MTEYRVLAWKDTAPPGNGWVTKCLEFDCGSQGRTLAEAMNRLEDVIKADVTYAAATGATNPATPEGFQFIWDSIENFPDYIALKVNV